MSNETYGLMYLRWGRAYHVTSRDQALLDAWEEDAVWNGRIHPIVATRQHATDAKIRFESWYHGYTPEDAASALSDVESWGLEAPTAVEYLAHKYVDADRLEILLEDTTSHEQLREAIKDLMAAEAHGVRGESGP